MTNKEKIDLIKRYAPILWMHDDDAFLPEDCGVMEKFAKVGKSESDMESKLPVGKTIIFTLSLQNTAHLKILNRTQSLIIWS